MSQESVAVRPFTIPVSQSTTYKRFSEALSAYWAGNRVNLIDIVHSSPRLTQWSKVSEGYRIWSIDEVLSVTVTPDRIYTTKGNRNNDLQTGLPAQTLYNSIQTAQAIVQAHGSTEDEDDYFTAGGNFAAGA